MAPRPLTLLLACAILLQVLPALPGSGEGEGGGGPRGALWGPYLQNLSSTSVMIRWATDAPSGGAVRYGKTGLLDRLANESQPTRFHEVTLSGLEPGTAYGYTVEAGDGPGPLSSFRTPSAGAEGFRFGVYGDTQGNATVHSRILEWMRSLGAAFFLHAGDLVDSGQSTAGWSAFLETLSPLANDTPLWPALGNHDLPPDGFIGNFSLPGNERYYSFDRGGAHFTVLDATDDLGNGSAQNEWLRADLRSRAGPIWKFVLLHYPPWSSGFHGSDLTVREALDPLLVLHGASAVFSGHDHDYEHARPGNGVEYFVTGGGGGLLGPVVPSWFTVRAESVHHFLMVDVECENATVTAHRLDGSVLETVRLALPDRSPPGAPTGLRVLGADRSSISLAWDPNTEPDLAGYRVYINDTGPSAGFRVLASLGPVMTFNATDLALGTDYRFALDAVDGASPVPNNSTLSAVVAASTLPLPANRPPSVKVMSPSDGALFRSDTLLGLACDAADPDLASGDSLSFEWRSNVSGLLGRERNLTGISLAPGDHALTVTVADSTGATASDGVRVRVVPPPRPPPPDGAGRSPDGFPWEAVVIVAVAAALTATLVLVLRRARS